LLENSLAPLLYPAAPDADENEHDKADNCKKGKKVHRSLALLLFFFPVQGIPGEKTYDPGESA
jgi:hypothetical protein